MVTRKSLTFARLRCIARNNKLGEEISKWAKESQQNVLEQSAVDVKSGDLADARKRAYGFLKLAIGYLTPVFLMPITFVFGTNPIKCMYIMAVMIMLWVFEPVPYQITSFVPLIMGPMLNLTTTKYLARYYFNEPIANSIAGLTVALIAQSCGLNRRISYNLILVVGPRIKWLMLSFMSIVFFLSMFISNVAVTGIMMTVVDTLIYEISQSKLRKRVNDLLKKRNSQTEELDFGDVVHMESVKSKQLRKTFLLSIGYSATLGGISFVTGNRTNIEVVNYINRIARGQWLTTISWMLYCLPVGLISMLLGWAFLYTVYMKDYEHQSQLDIKEVKDVVREKLENMPRTHAEILSTFLFGLCLILWVTKKPVFIPGWSDLLHLQEDYATDSSVGFLIAFIAFMVPVKSFNFSLEHRLMEWKFIQKNMPWAVIFIIGGGTTLTEVITKSTLFDKSLENVKDAEVGLNPSLFLAVAVSSLITEFTNAETTVYAILRYAEARQRQRRSNPFFYALPMGLANNFAFILPSSEAWNAIVYEIGGLSVIDMIIPGLFMKAVALTLSMVSFYTTGRLLFSITDEGIDANATVSNPYYTAKKVVRRRSPPSPRMTFLRS